MFTAPVTGAPYDVSDRTFTAEVRDLTTNELLLTFSFDRDVEGVPLDDHKVRMYADYTATALIPDSVGQEAKWGICDDLGNYFGKGICYLSTAVPELAGGSPP